MSIDVNRAYFLNPPSSSVGALGCAIVACVVSIIRTRLRLADNDRRNLWSRASFGIAGDATLMDAWALESSL